MKHFSSQHFDTAGRTDTDTDTDTGTDSGGAEAAATQPGTRRHARLQRTRNQILALPNEARGHTRRRSSGDPEVSALGYVGEKKKKSIYRI